MSKCKAVKVLGAGSPILDLLVKVEEAYLARISGTKGGMELVSPSQLEEILAGAGAEPVLAPGGSAANTVFGLAQLGLPTALLGKLGPLSKRQRRSFPFQIS
jgi:sugar/nucleoside kinase (ribokinase family)